MTSSWRQPPLFDEPPVPPVQLSKTLAVFEYRLARAEAASWTAVKLKTYRPCQECACLQHERDGDFGPRRQAKHRRRRPTGPTLELCNAHAEQWKARDERDTAAGGGPA
jgi:hypothetical protein